MQDLTRLVINIAILTLLVWVFAYLMLIVFRTNKVSKATFKTWNERELSHEVEAIPVHETHVENHEKEWSHEVQTNKASMACFKNSANELSEHLFDMNQLKEVSILFFRTDWEPIIFFLKDITEEDLPFYFSLSQEIINGSFNQKSDVNYLSDRILEILIPKEDRYQLLNHQKSLKKRVHYLTQKIFDNIPNLFIPYKRSEEGHYYYIVKIGTNT